ncbi:MAG: ATP:cob(I)alamin adenosyltransferase [Bacteroidales bacterium]|nr:MAG: ATP:cob(I)alamin adenosyltransferase [Bacteroidales bacterium]
MKVYTKTGDKGQTSLVGGKRVLKSDRRIEAYGTIDELNSFLGLLRSKLEDEEYKEFIYAIQKSLFTVGAILATPADYDGKPIVFEQETIANMEQQIDRIGASLPPLREFIVYGSNEVSSIAHVCRAIARRAERQMVELNQVEAVDNNLMVYINRLSDYLFTLGMKLS